MNLVIYTSEQNSLNIYQEQKHLASKIILVNWQEHEYTRPYGETSIFYEMNQFCIDRNIPLEVITGTSEYAAPLHDKADRRFTNLKVIHFPYHCTILGLHSFLSEDSYNIIEKNEIYQAYIENANKNFQFPFICLNSKPHAHRCLQMDLLAKHNLIDNNAISWNSWYDYQGRDISKSLEYDWKYWFPKCLILDELPTERLGWNGILPKQYINSYAHLVTESSANSLFISEKLVTPLLFNKPFLVSGAKNYHKMLQDYGFELYDEIFDYAFDSVNDIELRYSMLCQNLEDLQTRDLNKLKALTKDKAIRNKKHFENFINNLDRWPEDIKKFFETYDHRHVTINFDYYEEIKFNKLKIIRD